MTRRAVRTAKPVEARNAHSAGVVASGRFLFTSGLVARDADGNVVGAGDMAAQVACVLANLDDVLAAAGADIADAIRLTTYVTDIDAYRAARAAHAGLFARVMSGAPAATLIEISRLADPDLMVEIEAVVALPGDAA